VNIVHTVAIGVRIRAVADTVTIKIALRVGIVRKSVLCVGNAIIISIARVVVHGRIEHADHMLDGVASCTDSIQHLELKRKGTN
jgi:hypothetical protein